MCIVNCRSLYQDLDQSRIIRAFFHSFCKRKKSQLKTQLNHQIILGSDLGTWNLNFYRPLISMAHQYQASLG